MRKTGLLSCTTLSAWLLLSTAATAEILFSEDFDDQADWNSSQSSDLLDNWDGRASSNRGGDLEVTYINSAGGHGETGKGFTQFWDSTEPYHMAQGAQIWTSAATFHPPEDFYVGFWYQVDPRWDWGGADRLKIFRIYNHTGSSVIPTWSNFCSEAEDNGSGGTWAVPPGCGMAICTNPSRQWAGCWNDINDGGWHSFIFHFASSGELDTYQVWVDGNESTYGNVSGDFFPDGPFDGSLNFGFSFGGNLSDGGGGVSEMWSRYDNIVVATSFEDVVAFLGVQTTDVTPPVMSSLAPASPQLCE